MKSAMGIVRSWAVATLLFHLLPSGGRAEGAGQLDKIYLKNGAIFQGVWDPESLVLHLIDKNNQPAGDITIKTNNVLRIERNTVPLGSGVSTSSLELKLSDVEKSEADLKEQLKVLATLKKQLAAAEKSRTDLHKLYAGKSVSAQLMPALLKKYKDADQSVANYTLAVSTTQAYCVRLYKAYQGLGGKTLYPECQ